MRSKNSWVLGLSIRITMASIIGVIIAILTYHFI